MEGQVHSVENQQHEGILIGVSIAPIPALNKAWRNKFIAKGTWSVRIYCDPVLPKLSG